MSIPASIEEKLPEQQSNKTYKFTEINELYNNSFAICSAGIYYPYDHVVKDSGWGCAWRAIQTLLSTRGIHLSFYELYLKLSIKDELIDIISKAKKYDQETIELLKNKAWAPAEIPGNWAEPFIGSIACLYYKISHSLLLLNAPAQSYAPPSVFQATINFKEFCSLIKKVITKSSVMIDDGKYALSIIGYTQETQQGLIEFLFADPHIKSNKQFKEVGVYRKTFNLEGKGVKNQQTDIQKSQSLYQVYEKLEFQTKPWMICYIAD